MNGELIVNLSEPREKSNLLQHIRSLDGLHRIAIKKHRKGRSPQQNRYYHGVVVAMITDHLRAQGYNEFTEDLVHEYLKDQFLQRTVVNEQTGEYIKVSGSTASLDTVRFNEYIETVKQYAAERLGLFIPDPI